MPEMVQQALSYGVVGKAFEEGFAQLQIVNPREYIDTNYKAVDDKPFGGGEGMLLQGEPFLQALSALKSPGKVYLMSPQGVPWSHEKAKDISSLRGSITLVCGRYEGIDQRFINQYVDEEISLGDFVLSGGEIASIAIVDSLIRLIPGALGNENSAPKDSFYNGLLKAPSFTRPAIWQNEEVPPVLLSGHHKNIEEWKHYFSLVITHQKKPILIERRENLVELKKAYEYVLSRDEKEIFACGLVKKDLFYFFIQL